jgi:hypothetical protein
MAMSYTGPLIVVAGIHRVMENGNPRYLLPAHRNSLRSDPQGDRSQFVLSSTTLMEWKLESHVPQPTSGPNVFLHEGNISESENPGELKMMMRTADYADERKMTDPPRAFSTISRDGGRTWSPAQQEPELWNAKSKAFYTKGANGSHLYVYNDGPANPAPGGRMALRYKIKPEGGQWSSEKTFYEAGLKNSYPTLIEVAPGDFRAVWDSGTKDRARTQIMFGKFRLAPEAK